MHETEGIILNVLPFKDYDQILTLFTPDLGIAKLMFKGGGSVRRRAGAVSTPLVRAQIVYTKGKGELLLLRELSILDHNLPLRQNFDNLSSACQLANAIQKSQLPGKPSTLLYKLFVTYLEKLPTISPPTLISSSFLLKLLRHEGLLHLHNECASCRSCVTHLSHGECYCKTHAPYGAILLTPQEWDNIYKLTYCQKLSELPTDAPFKKVFQIFEQITLA